MVKEEKVRIDFLKNIKSHKITIEINQGFHRSIAFRREDGSYTHFFRIITAPHFLSITGDMGTWSFSRLPDNFTFFRDSKLQINASYWAEKLLTGHRASYEEAQIFDPDLYKQSVIQSLDYYSLTASKRRAIAKALRKEIPWDDEESYVRSKVADFKHDGFRFQDVWEIDGRAYDYRYLWCCYAIVWGIQQYDKIVESLPAAFVSNEEKQEVHEHLHINP